MSAEMKNVKADADNQVMETSGEESSSSSSSNSDNNGGRRIKSEDAASITRGCGVKKSAPSPSGQGENYGLGKIRAVMKACKNNPDLKPSLSYIALISLAIQHAPRQRILLGDIYQWLMDNFPYYKIKERSWRNSIRHNLSLNECFVKVGRGDSGKGNYWAVHPANIEDFKKGDFRRRHARRRVKHCNEDQEKHQLRLMETAMSDSQAHQDFNDKPLVSNQLGEPNSTMMSPSLTGNCGYVPMTLTRAPASVLVEMFGARNILTPQERMQLQMETGMPINNSSSSGSNSQVMVDSDYKHFLHSVGARDTEQAAMHLGQLSDHTSWLQSAKPEAVTPFVIDVTQYNATGPSDGNPASSCRFSSLGYPIEEPSVTMQNTVPMEDSVHQPQSFSDVTTYSATSSTAAATTTTTTAAATGAASSWNTTSLELTGATQGSSPGQDVSLEQLLNGSGMRTGQDLRAGLELLYNSVQMTVTTSVSGKLQGVL